MFDIIAIKKYFLTVLFLTGALMGGCARKYVPLILERQSYTLQAKETDPVVVQYSEDNVLADNKRYAKKAAKKGIQFLALKIHNPSTDTALVQVSGINITRQDGSVAVPVPFSAYSKKIKQAAWPYLLFVPLDFGYTSRSGIEYGRMLGLSPSNAFIPAFTAWGLFNTGWAIKANHDFRRDFKKHQLESVRIAPGKTVYKIMSIENKAKQTTSIKMGMGSGNNFKH